MLNTNINSIVKALLIFGSALIFVCCGAKRDDSVSLLKERTNSRVLTESSENLSVMMSENGRPSYIFSAPRVEGYTLSNEPYREFLEGVEIVTFSDDSLNVESARMRSNYAIFYENRKLWETMGDVVVVKSDGKELYSQQLFWNSQTKRIYSNVDTKIIDRNTGDIYEGEGFESDEAMEEWSFRRLKGQMKMAIKPKDRVEPDSLSGDSL